MLKSSVISSLKKTAGICVSGLLVLKTQRGTFVSLGVCTMMTLTGSSLAR